MPGVRDPRIMVSTPLLIKDSEGTEDSDNFHDKKLEMWRETSDYQ